MKKILCLLLAVPMMFTIAGCGNAAVPDTAYAPSSDYLFSMTKSDLMEYINECVDAYNADHKYEPVDTIESISYGYKNSNSGFSFHVNENEDGTIQKVSAKYFGSNGVTSNGMKPVTAFGVYLSILINLFAESDATTVGNDADEFFASKAKYGEIEASNGILFEWSNLTLSKYWYGATIKLSEDPEPTPSPEPTPTPTFDASALEIMQALDDLCFANDYYIEGEDPHITDHYEKVNRGYICTPTPAITLTFNENENGALTGVIFDYNKKNDTIALSYSYFNDYVEYFLQALYGYDEAQPMISELGTWGALTTVYSNTTKNGNDKWTYTNVDTSGHLLFHGIAGG